jgi:hypothetical protein
VYIVEMVDNNLACIRRALSYRECVLSVKLCVKRSGFVGAEFPENSAEREFGQPGWVESDEEAIQRIVRDMELAVLHVTKLERGVESLQRSREIWAGKLRKTRELIALLKRSVGEHEEHGADLEQQVAECDKTLFHMRDMANYCNEERQRLLRELEEIRSRPPRLVRAMGVPIRNGKGGYIDLVRVESQKLITLRDAFALASQRGGVSFDLRSEHDKRDILTACRLTKMEFVVMCGERSLNLKPGTDPLAFGSLDEYVAGRLIACRFQKDRRI